MSPIKIYIKNMCCERCIVQVRQIFLSLKLKPSGIRLGEVTLRKDVPEGKMNVLKTLLKQKGFALAISKDDRVVVEIQRMLIQNLDEQVLGIKKRDKISVYLSRSLNLNYNKLSKSFSHATGITIEKYFIRLKMEKAKEFLILGEMDIADIAWLLGYSTSQNFSTIFKKETGRSPGEYRANPIPHRLFRDKLLGKKSNKKNDKENINQC